VRDLHAGFPVSNTGDLLAVGKAERDLADSSVAALDYTSFLLSRLARFRQIYTREGVGVGVGVGGGLQEGLIHGDAFLDNTLFNEASFELVALVDWEDACRAPLVLDLAVAIAGAAFTPDHELVPARGRALVEGYTGKRALSGAELVALPDFVWAAVMACGAWRFLNFNKEKPESPLAAKASYEGMWRRAEWLEANAGWAGAVVGG